MHLLTTHLMQKGWTHVNVHVATNPLPKPCEYQDDVSSTPHATVNYRANTGVSSDNLSPHMQQSSYMQFTHPPKQQEIPIDKSHIRPSYINILLLGTAKSGKYTIAKHIATCSDGKFEKNMSTKE